MASQQGANGEQVTRYGVARTTVCVLAVNFCATVNKQPHHISEPKLCCEEEGRTLVVIYCVEVGTAVDQQLADIDVIALA